MNTDGSFLVCKVFPERIGLNVYAVYVPSTLVQPMKHIKLNNLSLKVSKVNTKLQGCKGN